MTLMKGNTGIKGNLAEYVRTCIACPAQWEGYLDDGTWIYVRCRWGKTRVDYGKQWNTIYSEDKEVFTDLQMKAFLRRAGITSRGTKEFPSFSYDWENREKLAELMHKSYEKEAKRVGWKTQKKCKVEFKELPSKNRWVMVKTAGDVLDWIKSKQEIRINPWKKEEK